MHSGVAVELDPGGLVGKKRGPSRESIFIEGCLSHPVRVLFVSTLPKIAKSKFSEIHEETKLFLKSHGGFCT